MPLPEVNRDNIDDLLFKPGTDAEPRTAILPPPKTTADVLRQLSDIRLNEQFEGQTEPQFDLDPGLSREEREEILHKILADLLDDPEAAYQPVSVLYQDFQVRCRIEKSLKTTPELQEFRQLLAVARAGVDEKEDTLDEDQWKQAGLIADQLPEDMRGVYLLLAKGGSWQKRPVRPISSWPPPTAHARRLAPAFC